MHITRRTFLHATAALGSAAVARPAPSDRITVAMLGCGARAHELMAAILQIPEAEIVGLVDAYTGRIERALDRVKGRARRYADYREVLADPSIDTVVVATPDHWHKQMVLDAVRAGKDVYCEKPLTYTSAEGKEIIAAARENRRIVQVGSQGMSTPQQRAAKEAIAAGKLGKVTLIRAAYNRNTASGAWIYPIPPDASPQTVNWEMFLGPAPKRPFSLERFFRWRCYQDYSGGIATDLFVHLCTAIHHLMDAQVPSRVVALGQLYRWTESRDVPDTLNAVLEYPEGFAVNLSSTFNNQMAAEGSIQILGTEGALTLGGELIFYPENAREDNRWIVESWPRRLEEAYWKDPRVIASEIEPAKRPWKKPEKIEFENADATVEHFRHFFTSVRTRTPYWQDAAAGHHAAACAHMVNLAASERRMAEWDFTTGDIRKV